MDYYWFFSTIAQCSAALVGFLIVCVVFFIQTFQTDEKKKKDIKPTLKKSTFSILCTLVISLIFLFEYDALEKANYLWIGASISLTVFLIGSFFVWKLLKDIFDKCF